MREIIVKTGLFALSLATASTLSLLAVLAIWFSTAWLVSMAITVRDALLSCH